MIRLCQPDEKEIQWVLDHYAVDKTDLCAALDEEESSRVEIQKDSILILIDVPVTRKDQANSFETVPLGILLCPHAIITVCTQQTGIIAALMDSPAHDINLKKKMRFVYQILYQCSQEYQKDLRIIDKARQNIEKRIGKSTKEKDLISLHNLESTLVYFSTSLHANEGVLDRLSRYTSIPQYEQDKDLLDDVQVETKQAIEMAAIYRDIVRGTRDLISTIQDSRLNNVMKYLTSITLVMAVPTIISGFYGMNVDEQWMPFADTPYGFAIICVLTLIVCIFIIFILHK